MTGDHTDRPLESSCRDIGRLAGSGESDPPAIAVDGLTGIGALDRRRSSIATLDPDRLGGTLAQRVVHRRGLNDLVVRVMAPGGVEPNPADPDTGSEFYDVSYPPLPDTDAAFQSRTAAGMATDPESTMLDGPSAPSAIAPRSTTERGPESAGRRSDSEDDSVTVDPPRRADDNGPTRGASGTDGHQDTAGQLGGAATTPQSDAGASRSSADLIRNVASQQRRRVARRANAARTVLVDRTGPDTVDSAATRAKGGGETRVDVRQRNWLPDDGTQSSVTAGAPQRDVDAPRADRSAPARDPTRDPAGADSVGRADRGTTGVSQSSEPISEDRRGRSTHGDSSPRASILAASRFGGPVGEFPATDSPGHFRVTDRPSDTAIEPTGGATGTVPTAVRSAAARTERPADAATRTGRSDTVTEVRSLRDEPTAAAEPPGTGAPRTESTDYLSVSDGTRSTPTTRTGRSDTATQLRSVTAADGPNAIAESPGSAPLRTGSSDQLSASDGTPSTPFQSSLGVASTGVRSRSGGPRTRVDTTETERAPTGHTGVQSAAQRSSERGPSAQTEVQSAATRSDERVQRAPVAATGRGQRVRGGTASTTGTSPESGARQSWSDAATASDPAAAPSDIDRVDADGSPTQRRPEPTPTRLASTDTGPGVSTAAIDGTTAARATWAARRHRSQAQSRSVTADERSPETAESIGTMRRPPAGSGNPARRTAGRSSQSPEPEGTAPEYDRTTATPERTVSERPSTAAGPERTVSERPGATAVPERTVSERPSATAVPEWTVSERPSATAAPERTVSKRPSTTAIPERRVSERASTTVAPERTGATTELERVTPALEGATPAGTDTHVATDSRRSGRERTGPSGTQLSSSQVSDPPAVTRDARRRTRRRPAANPRRVVSTTRIQDPDTPGADSPDSPAAQTALSTHVDAGRPRPAQAVSGDAGERPSSRTVDRLVQGDRPSSADSDAKRAVTATRDNTANHGAVSDARPPGTHSAAATRSLDRTDSRRNRPVTALDGAEASEFDRDAVSGADTQTGTVAGRVRSTDRRSSASTASVGAGEPVADVSSIGTRALQRAEHSHLSPTAAGRPSTAEAARSSAQSSPARRTLSDTDAGNRSGAGPQSARSREPRPSTDSRNRRQFPDGTAASGSALSTPSESRSSDLTGHTQTDAGGRGAPRSATREPNVAPTAADAVPTDPGGRPSGAATGRVSGGEHRPGAEPRTETPAQGSTTAEPAARLGGDRGPVSSADNRERGPKERRTQPAATGQVRAGGDAGRRTHLSGRARSGDETPDVSGSAAPPTGRAGPSEPGRATRTGHLSGGIGEAVVQRRSGTAVTRSATDSEVDGHHGAAQEAIGTAASDALAATRAAATPRAGGSQSEPADTESPGVSPSRNRDDGTDGPTSATAPMSTGRPQRSPSAGDTEPTGDTQTRTQRSTGPSGTRRADSVADVGEPTGTSDSPGPSPTIPDRVFARTADPRTGRSAPVEGQVGEPGAAGQPDSAAEHTAAARTDPTAVSTRSETQTQSDKRVKYKHGYTEYNDEAAEESGSTSNTSSMTEPQTEPSLVYRQEATAEPDDTRSASGADDGPASPAGQPPQRRSHTATFPSEQGSTSGLSAGKNDAGRDRRAAGERSAFGGDDAFDTGDGPDVESALPDDPRDTAADTARSDRDRLDNLDFQLGDQSMQLNADVDRLVDILYRKLERKRRIERQRRGF